MSKRKELIAERQQLIDEHLKQHNELVKKTDSWIKKNWKGGLDGTDPYEEEDRKLKKVFWEKIKKINAELEKLKD